MSFYWYLDIEENSFSGADGATGLPIGKGAQTTFSVGPIEFTDGETLTVIGLVTRINTAFEDAFEEGVSPNRYYIEARLRPIGSAVGISKAAENKLNTAESQRELAVEYKIYNTDNIGFSLQFRSGRHGSESGLPVTPGEVPAASVTIRNDPSIVAYSTAYCQIDAAITDKPPVPPDIVFVPFVGVNNKIMILFNSNAGEKKEYPIILRDNDVSFILDEYFAQHGVELKPDAAMAIGVGHSERDAQKKLQYRNDDPIRKYELFRVGAAPTSYNSFKGFNVTNAPIQAELGPDKFSTAVAYVDRIVPNVKYWYCARSIDIHENISNPTYIFELEMVDNRGQMFMRQKIFAFKPQKLDYKKTGRRFLAIEPRYEQMNYNDNEESPGTVSLNEAPSSNILGQGSVREVSSIWGKKFKVRVTSKKTGRKIDLNVAFKNTGVVIP